MTITPNCIAAAALGALLSACATQGPQPTEELTRARTLIEQADKSGAQRYAAADLQRAHDELNNADRSNSDRKYDDARRYAQSAEVDADVAAARASAAQAQRAAREVASGNATLEQESGRASTNGSPPDAGATAPTPPATTLPPATPDPSASESTPNPN